MFHGLLSGSGYHPCQNYRPGNFLSWGPGFISQGMGHPLEAFPPASVLKQTLPWQGWGGRGALARQALWENLQTVMDEGESLSSWTWQSLASGL